jgi:MFS family permease
VQWLVFDRTHDPLASGLVGFAQFAPLLLMALVGGVVADRFNRRTVIAVCHAALVLIAGVFVLVAARPQLGMGPVYGALVLLGVTRAFTGPASQAIVPTLVPPESFNRAVAAGSVVLNLATLVGPALGGFVYEFFEHRHMPQHAFTVCAAVFLTAFFLLSSIPGIPAPARRREAGAAAVSEGLRYVWSNKPVLGAVSLDLFAVLLGGAVALLPFFAKDILHAGPREFGFLRGATALGAVSMALVLTVLPLRKHAGLVMFASVAVFGVATMVFGVSSHVWLSVAALFVAGAADMISVQVRHTLVQLRTPDAMRGRVSAVNMVFITASNEFGEFESGLTAKWLGPVHAVVLGGIGTCIVVVVWMLLFPSLRKFGSLEKGA